MTSLPPGTTVLTVTKEQEEAWDAQQQAAIEQAFKEAVKVFGMEEALKRWAAVAKGKRRQRSRIYPKRDADSADYAKRDAELLDCYDYRMTAVPGATHALIVADIARRAPEVLQSCKGAGLKAIEQALRRALKARDKRKGEELAAMKARWGSHSPPASVLGTPLQDRKVPT